MLSKLSSRRIPIRVLLVLFLILVSSTSTLSAGLKRHGEDVGEVPLAIPVKELTVLINNSISIIASKNTGLASDILEVLEALMRVNNTSRIVFYSNILYKYLNNTSIPWMSRFDYIGLSILASIEGSYDNIVIIDPVRLTMLLKGYEKDRTRWLIEKIARDHPLLAEYINRYNNAENITSRKILLDRIRRILAGLAGNGKLDIILLASEALNTTTPMGFMVDRIKLAEYLNNTVKVLEKYNVSIIARIIRLMRTISHELYQGEVGTAWQYFSILREEVLKLNITLTFEDAVKLSALFSITGITINGAFISTASFKTTSTIIADILSSVNYDVKLKATNILAGILSKKNRIGGEAEIPLHSFKILATMLATNNSEASLGMLVLRQPVIARSTEYSVTTNVMSSPIVFTIIISISAIVAGIILYSTIRLPVSKTPLENRNRYFNEIPFRKDKYSRMIIEYYIRAVKVLASKGYPRFRWETPREHLLKIEGTSCYELFSKIVELYEKTVFAEEPVIVEKRFLEELLERIEKCI